MEELTICTVSFHHQDFVAKNIDLSARLNPESMCRFRWLVVENTPDFAALPQRLDGPCRVEWLEGESSKDFSGPSGPGFHHGAAINKALKHVRTRYLLTIDPDFFILRERWVDDVLRDMKDRKLAALGAPWNPVWYGKPRYVPACAHCLFLDLEQLDRSQLDFQPGRKVNPAPPARRIPAILRKPAETVMQYYRWFWRDRFLVGKDKDTGYQIAEALGNARLEFECLVPVFDPVRDFSGPWIVRHLDRMFGDERRYIPRDERYFSRSGFEQRGMESARKIGCEEFLWKDEPFGFHFRGYPKRMSGEFGAAKSLLFDYLDKTLKREPLPTGTPAVFQSRTKEVRV